MYSLFRLLQGGTVINMNTGNLVSLNWEKELQVFKKNLSVLRKNHRKNALHDLRVAVKKLRAFLELGLLLSRDKEDARTLQAETILNYTESLFTVSGRQRDLEICLEIVSTFKKETGHPFSELNSFFRSCLKKAGTWTRAGIQHFKITELHKAGRLLEQKIEHTDPLFLNSTIMEQVTGQIPLVQHWFHKPHQLRKKLKTIYYWLQIVKPESAETTSLHEILDNLGDWQDLGIMETRVKHFRQELLPGVFDEKSYLKEMEKEIEIRKKVLLKSAISKTRKWIKAFS